MLMAPTLGTSGTKQSQRREADTKPACLSTRRPVYPPVCLFIYLFSFLSTCPLVYPPIYLSNHLSVYFLAVCRLFTCLLNFPSAYPSTYLPVHLPVYIFTFLCTCLPAELPVYLFTHLPSHLHIHLATHLSTWPQCGTHS